MATPTTNPAGNPPTPMTTPAEPAKAAEVKVGGYSVRQSIEVGGRMVSTAGSLPMWNTMVNQSSGGRVLNQSLEMRALKGKKTPFVRLRHRIR